MPNTKYTMFLQEPHFAKKKTKKTPLDATWGFKKWQWPTF